jgi:hypothetical protein
MCDISLWGVDQFSKPPLHPSNTWLSAVLLVTEFVELHYRRFHDKLKSNTNPIVQTRATEHKIDNPPRIIKINLNRDLLL